MKKIPTLFVRDRNTNLVVNEVTPGCEWVLSGAGYGTRKYDGTCCLIRDGKLYKRYEVGRGKQAPENFEPASEVDPITGKQQGWVPVNGAPGDRWHCEAFARPMAVAKQLGESAQLCEKADGTYELIGPKVQGNPERAIGHWLVAHGRDILEDCPRDFEGLKAYLGAREIEGIVWHHPDGRMAKIKRRDFAR